LKRCTRDSCTLSLHDALPMLPGSTEVWLNTDTKIGFFRPFEHGETREVTLLEGEAFFSVSPDKTKPFIVHAQGIETRVLGTSFKSEEHTSELQSRENLVCRLL